MKLTQQQLNTMITKHNLYLNHEEGGEKLVLIDQDLQGLNFEKQNLAAADLTGSDFSLANLNRANLRCAKLEGACFTKAKLVGANLELIHGENTSFVDADMRHVILRDADLTNTDLSFARISNANLKLANLEKANLSNANLFESDLRYAKMRDVKIRLTNLLGACIERISYQTIITCNVNLGFAEFSTISYWVDQDLWVSSIGEGDLELIEDRLAELKDVLDRAEEGRGTKLKASYDRAIQYIQEEVAQLQK